jgi:hypothetical protein
VSGSFLSAGREEDVEKEEAWYVQDEQRYGDGLLAAALGRRRSADLSIRIARRILFCVAEWLSESCSRWINFSR